MADVNVNDLTAAGAATGTMKIEVDTGSASQSVTVNQLQNQIIRSTATGLVTRTAANTVAQRTITAGNGIAVSNGNGVSGNPTISADHASQAEAEAGSNTAKTMTPQRVAQANARRIRNAQTNTTYTLVLADAGKLLTFANASAVTVTIPPNSSVAFGSETQIDVVALCAGKVTFAPGSGVTLQSKDSNTKLAAQYSAGTLIKTDGTNTWLLVGDLSS